VHLPVLSVRRLSGAAAIACTAVLAPVAALAAAAFPAAPARAAAAASTPKCTTSGLVVWLDTRGSGTAGSIYYHLKFTNLSRQACTLRGYPGVSAVDLAGHQLGSAASQNHHLTPHLVSLASGATVTAVLQIGDTGHFPPSTCRRVTAAGLRVYPPNQTAAKLVPFPFSACSRTGPVYLSVEALA
jgi:curli biogenesis system outer membrane secretion channel CsgG